MPARSAELSDLSRILGILSEFAGDASRIVSAIGDARMGELGICRDAIPEILVRLEEELALDLDENVVDSIDRVQDLLHLVHAR